jgi:pilus assembly protein CpaE
VSETIKTFVALDAGVDREEVRAAIPDHHELAVVGLVDGLEESWSTLQETSTDVLVVCCAGYSDRALFLIEGAVKQRPDRPVVVLCQSSPNGFVRRVFEAGADDIITLPVSAEHVRFTLQKAVARRQGAAAASGVAQAPLICILGPKGGTGKTLTACNLAVSLAKAGRRTAVVDLDLQFGDVALALGMSPERTLYDLAKSGGSLDGDKLDGYLVAHSSGLRVLMAPTRPDQAGTVTVEFLRELYTALRATNDYVVVDTPPGFTPEVIASIDSSTDVIMVGALDSLSLKNTKLGLETLELMGYDAERIRLVLNRADTRVGITRDEVIAIVGRPPDVLIPSDREIPCAVNEGTPIVVSKERSEAARAFEALAERFLHADPTATQNGRLGRFHAARGLLRGRKS